MKLPAASETTTEGRRNSAARAVVAKSAEATSLVAQASSLCEPCRSDFRPTMKGLGLKLNTARQSSSQTALECADLSALFVGGTCHARGGDKSPGKKAATGRRTPEASRRAMTPEYCSAKA